MGFLFVCFVGWVFFFFCFVVFFGKEKRNTENYYASKEVQLVEYSYQQIACFDLV